MEKTHQIKGEWQCGLFRLRRCACGREVLFAGEVALNLSPRDVYDLWALLNIAHRVRRREDESPQPQPENHNPMEGLGHWN